MLRHGCLQPADHGVVVLTTPHAARSAHYRQRPATTVLWGVISWWRLCCIWPRPGRAAKAAGSHPARCSSNALELARIDLTQDSIAQALELSPPPGHAGSEPGCGWRQETGAIRDSVKGLTSQASSTARLADGPHTGVDKHLHRKLFLQREERKAQSWRVATGPVRRMAPAVG